MNKNIAVIFKAVRKFSGFHQTEMSAILGITQGTISKIESAAMRAEMSLWFDFVKKFRLKDPYFCLHGGLELETLDNIQIKDFKSPFFPKGALFQDDRYFLVKDIRPVVDYFQDHTPYTFKAILNKHKVYEGVFSINNHPLPLPLVEDIFINLKDVLVSKKLEEMNLNFNSSLGRDVEYDDFKSNLNMFQKVNRWDDFQSTFTMVSDNQLINMLQGENDFPEVSSIIKKYLGDVEVEFKKLNKMPGEHDVYLITVQQKS